MTRFSGKKCAIFRFLILEFRVGVIQFNSIHFICQSVVCNCKYVTLKYMNITDSRETPTKVQ